MAERHERGASNDFGASEEEDEAGAFSCSVSLAASETLAAQSHVGAPSPDADGYKTQQSKQFMGQKHFYSFAVT